MPGHRDPRSMMAQRLEANVHLITGSTQEHDCLIGAVNQAHLAVEETVFEALAATYAAVLPEDRREGMALVDIGAHSTDLVVYYGERLQLGLQPARSAATTSRAMWRWRSASASKRRSLVRTNTAARRPSDARQQPGGSDVAGDAHAASCRAAC